MASMRVSTEGFVVGRKVFVYRSSCAKAEMMGQTSHTPGAEPCLPRGCTYSEVPVHLKDVVDSGA